MLEKKFSRDIESKWQAYWKAKGYHRFDQNSSKPVFSIDTPPPFTSGTLHLGHVYNHVWIDIVARYKRMKGFNVLLPQGFDCHGLPTELRVEKEYGIRKENREEFIKKCHEWTESAISRMKEQFDSLGYSTDWDQSYMTMSDDYKKNVQKTLLEFYNKDMLYRAKHPVLWCWKCGTALAKAEVGYINKTGKLYYIDFDVEGNHKITIATTRPEMMHACVAVFVHPDDERYKNFIGKNVTLPLSGNTVPIIADEAVEPEFGTGAVYLCTFGDEQDIRWQRKYNLPVIELITPDGKLSEAGGEYAGLGLKEAKEKIVEALTHEGRIRKVEDLSHNVLCHTERSSCNTPIELLPLDQWFIKIRDFTDEIIEKAREMKWHPDYMLGRLEDWSSSMDWDWIISRQRVFGTPIPFWSCSNCGEVIPAKEDELPVDPRGTTRKCKCGSDAVGSTDVCDCWIDSSISPLQISKWGIDDSFFRKTYPVSLRPQGYEIIRTWAFYTIFRNLVLTGEPCFKDLMVNGMVCGADGKKMSKSLGNVIEPEEILEKYSADAVRQWAATGTLGEDYPFSWDECEHSQRFLTKLWNISRFIQGHLEDYKKGEGSEALRDVDKWMISKLQKIIKNCNDNLDNYVFNLPLQELRSFLWHDLADYYLEIVKQRLYKPELFGDESRKAAQYVLSTLLEASLKLLAPFIPHITEEIYTNLFSKESVTLQEYPTIDEGLIDEKAEELGVIMVQVTDLIRKYKTDNNMSLGAELPKGELSVPEGVNIDSIVDDIKGVGRIAELKIAVSDTGEFKFRVF